MTSARPPNPIQAGWVMTVEPGIYIREEGLAVRLENDVPGHRSRPGGFDGGHPG